MKTNSDRIVIILEKSGTGYGVSSPNITGCYSYGDSIDEAIENMKDAIATHLEYSKEIGENIEIPSKFKFDIRIETKVFFNLFKELNASAIAKRANMNPSLLRQYATGKKFPSIDQIKKIENGIKALANELSNINLV